jgi:hypothetical protein
LFVRWEEKLKQLMNQDIVKFEMGQLVLNYARLRKNRRKIKIKIYSISQSLKLVLLGAYDTVVLGMFLGMVNANLMIVLYMIIENKKLVCREVK